MNQTEELAIDRALITCQLLESNLKDILKAVQYLRSKFNILPRYIDYNVDLPQTATETSSVCSDDTNSSLSLTDQSSGDAIKGRTAGELQRSNVKLKWKCIKLRRELEATAAQATRMVNISNRQGQKKHAMLISAGSMLEETCVHR